MRTLERGPVPEMAQLHEWTVGGRGVRAQASRIRLAIRQGTRLHLLPGECFAKRAPELAQRYSKENLKEREREMEGRRERDGGEEIEKKYREMEGERRTEGEGGRERNI